ncbi:Hsp70 family protein [Actinoplanes sp. TFC3]|uniref:Hsp70 family protein n=1 Tax=Actinoplanes sp. TFC3 TaxID=1710355 RepID=UPI0008345DD5|nr:Hsp70 family protein [Actinoplanes sp. TFC3]
MLGVDLGTSHTVAMLRRPDGRVRPLLFDGQPLLPSAVYLDTTGRLHVGRDAIRLGYAEPGRLELHPKRHIDAATVLLGTAEVPVADLFAALLGAVAREAVATVGHLPPAVVTYPAAWGAQRQAVLAESLVRAGWPPATVVRRAGPSGAAGLSGAAGSRMVVEPVAAARYFVEVLRRPVPVGAAVAVFDFGGGTLDIAVVRNVAAGEDGRGRFEVAASGGLDDLGGLDLDAALADHLGGTLRQQEPGAWATLQEPVTLAQWRARRRFWDDVRGAKEMLSRTAEAPVPVPGVETALSLTRTELELVTAPLIRRGVAEAETIIKAAGLTPAELAGLFLVGGSSRVPLVARLLHSELGIAPAVLEQPEFPVAEGAIRSASEPSDTEPVDVAAAPVAPISDTLATTPTPPQPPAAAAPASSAELLSQRPAAAPPQPSAAEAPQEQVMTRAEAPRDTVDAAAPTVPAVPNGHQAAPAQESPDYPEPVDPWATGEAAAFAGMAPSHSSVPAASWLASQQEAGEPPKSAPLWTYRKMVAAISVLVVLGVGTGLAVWLWPRSSALDYRPLSQPVRVAPVSAVGSAFSAAVMRDGRAYFASADENGQLGVVAAEAGSGKVVWRSTEAGTSERWEQLFTTPDAVIAITANDYATSDRRMVLLNLKDGHKLWERRVADDDSLLFAGDTVVLVNRTENRLLGLRVREQGKTGWESKTPASEYGLSTTKVVAVSTPADFETATAKAEDGRLVQIGVDRSARVIDAGSGKVLAGPRPNVADPGDEVIAHDGRLVVAEAGDAHRLLAYDLGKMGEPRVLLTPPDTNTRFSKLTPCGTDRMCAVQETGYDHKTAQVIAVSTAKGGEVWHRGVAQVESLIPVGETVLAAQDSSPGQVTLLGDDGTVLWTRAGVANRIDAGNLLIFSKALTTSPDDPGLTGDHVGDDPVPLGSLVDVRSATCAWDTKNLACVAEKDFVLQTFSK